MNLEDYVGNYVNVFTTNGKEYKNHYVYGFTDWTDDVERGEDSIDIMESSNSRTGITLYRSEISRIEISK